MSKPRTTKSLAIHIGLDRVDPKHYSGWNGALASAGHDARDMHAIAKARGYGDTVILLNERAQAAEILSSIRAAKDVLRSGDSLLVTFAGHGGQVPDTNGDEPDGMDETWCAYDRQIVDDELYGIFGLFRRGVRILVVSDSCHSGTVIRSGRPRGGVPSQVRLFGGSAASRCHEMHRAYYDSIQQETVPADNVEVQASVVLLGACQDNQFAGDGPRNGAFTAALRKVWANGKFRGGLWRFRDTIAKAMPPWQTPSYFAVGRSNPAFERQQPFTP